MASNKQKLQGLIGPQPSIQRGAPYTVNGEAAAAAPPAETAVIQKGSRFTVSTADDPDAPLPEAVLALRVELREIARSYIGARRRSGKALLEAARWLSEARVAAEHGEWYDFLVATSTSADTAERLLRIYERAMQHAAFASAVADGRFTQSVAERLARESTPAAVIDEVLTAETPPTVAEVERAIRAARREATIVVAGEGGDDQIPQIAGFDHPADAESPSGSSALTPDLLQALITEYAAGLADIAQHAARVPLRGDVTQALDTIARALATIRASLKQH